MKSIEEEVRGGNVVVALVVLAIVGALVFALGFGVGWSRAASSRPATPASPATSSSSSSSSASSGAETTITLRKKSVAQPGLVDLDGAPRGGAKGSGRVEASKGAKNASHEVDPNDEWEITIKTVATSSTTTAAAASSSAPVDNHGDSVDNSPRHGRLGVGALLMPGVIACTFELASFELPADLVGMRAEIGLDVVANLKAAGAGVSVGPGSGKGFGLVGAFTAYDGSSAGVLVGAGLRF